MRPGGGAEKGHAYERLCCRALARWINGSDKILLLWRSATSGAHFTTTKGAKSQAGDIACVASPDDPGYAEALWFSTTFTMECKHTKPELMQLGHTSGFEKLWRQASDQARNLNREPILFGRFNSRKEFIGFSDLIGQQLETRVKKYVTYSFDSDLEPVTLFLLKEVLSLQFHDFEQLIKNIKKIS